jgi:phage baseplate assembly protein W
MTSARHPYRLTVERRLAEADTERHVADLVRLVLLTAPGERLHRPEFGAGLGATALFDPLQAGLLGVVELRARGSLEQTLGDRIEVREVTVRAEGESTVVATVGYRSRASGASATVAVRVQGPR